MSDLVGTSEDWFSRVVAHMEKKIKEEKEQKTDSVDLLSKMISAFVIVFEPLGEKTNNLGFNQVQSQKMVRGWKFWI